LAWSSIAISANYGKSMTSWIHRDNSDIFSYFKPLFQILATWLTMLYLLPVESPYLPVIIISGLLMLLFFIWISPRLYAGIKQAWRMQPALVEVNLGFIGGAIGLFFLLTYLAGIDITRGARYSFVYFSAVIILLALGLAILTRKQQILVSLVVLFSAVTVVFNLGYDKYYRPDLFLPILQSNSTPEVPRLVATPYKSLVQIGEIMGLAWVMKKDNSLLDTNFIFLHNQQISESLAQISTDFDLWLVNFENPLPSLPNCQSSLENFPAINGYSFFKYHCHRPA
jgi:uncharacterized membrane protein